MKKTERKGPKTPGSGKMKTRFLVQCIIPAALVMTLVCCVSVIFTQKMSAQNMMTALDGQQGSKLDSASGNMSGLLNENQIESFSSEVISITDSKVHSDQNYSPVEKLNEVVNRMASLSTIFTKIQVVDFDRNIVIGSRAYNGGYSGEFTGDEYWFDYYRISQGQNYLVPSPNINSREYSLFTWVYPIVNKYGKSVGAFVISSNDPTFLPIISMTTNIEEQLWFIIDDKGSLYYSSDFTRKDLDALVEAAYGYKNDRDSVIINNAPYLLKTSEIPKLDGYTLVYSLPLEPIIRQSRGTMILLATVSLVSIVLIIIFVMGFSTKIVKEINDVRKSVKGISENDFAEPMEIKTNDEMGLLVHEFNGVVEKLKYQAEHDGKTQYYNSETFAKKTLEYISADAGRTYAIVRVDIDNFSFINDIFDWEVGDCILLGVAEDLKNVFGEDAVYGYLGNDIFVVCTGYVCRESVIEKIESANEAIKKSAEKYMPVTPHFGICENAGVDIDINILCDYAGIALKTVKGNPLEIYAVYDEKFDENHKVQKFVESNKITALENRDFYIVLQPKCNIFTGEVVGAEALVRWKDHNTGEVISPGKFIPIFEKNGFVITLDRFVWEETCKVIKKWRDHGYKDIPVSVNVSRMHFTHDAFVDEFADLVDRYEIPKKLIEVEITESALLENSEDVLQEVMTKLKVKGFKLLMDDFASGYSSLIALQRLPFDVIKIDKGLIDKIGDGFNRNFVAGIISFLTEINKEIVVEGVEYDWQKEILKNTGGTVIQGFCFSRPVSVSDFETLAFGAPVPETDADKQSD